MYTMRISRKEFEGEYPVMFEDYKEQATCSKEDHASILELARRWQEKSITFPNGEPIPDWFVRRAHARLGLRGAKKLCMKHNHPSGRGCLNKSRGEECSLDHQCILCGKEQHGLFFWSDKNGRYVCPKLVKWEKEIEAYKSKYGDPDRDYLKSLAKRPCERDVRAVTVTTNVRSLSFSVLRDAESELSEPGCGESEPETSAQNPHPDLRDDVDQKPRPDLRGEVNLVVVDSPAVQSYNEANDDEVKASSISSEPARQGKKKKSKKGKKGNAQESKPDGAMLQQQGEKTGECSTVAEFDSEKHVGAEDLQPAEETETPAVDSHFQSGESLEMPSTPRAPRSPAPRRTRDPLADSRLKELLPCVSVAPCSGTPPTMSHKRKQRNSKADPTVKTKEVESSDEAEEMRPEQPAEMTASPATQLPEPLLAAPHVEKVEVADGKDVVAEGKDDQPVDMSSSSSVELPEPLHVASLTEKGETGNAEVADDSPAAPLQALAPVSAQPCPNDPAYRVAPGLLPPPTVQLQGKKFRGFICSNRAMDLADCASKYLPHATTDLPQKFLHGHLGCNESDVAKRSLDDFNLYFVDASKLKHPTPNRLASKISFAYGSQFPMLGDVAVTCRNLDKKGNVALMNIRAFDRLQEKLAKVNEEAFNSWFELLAEKYSRSGLAGSFFYVPVHASAEHGPMHLQSEPTGWTQIAEYCAEQFEKQDAKSFDFNEIDSDDSNEEGADDNTEADELDHESVENSAGSKMFSAFRAKGMRLSYTKDSMNFVVVDQDQQTKDKRGHINMAVARYIYFKFGQAVLEPMLGKLRGDVIIFKALQYHSEDQCTAAPLEDEHLNYLQPDYKCSDADEEEIKFLSDQIDLSSVMNHWTLFPKRAQFFPKIKELDRMAQKEDWSYRLPSRMTKEKDHDLPYLVSFIKFRFALSVRHKKGIHIFQPSSDSNKTRMVFATGLLDMNLKPIYGIFERGREHGDSDDLCDVPLPDGKFVFKEWTSMQKAPVDVQPLSLLSKELLSKACETSGLQLHEIQAFDASVEVERSNIAHILRKKERFIADNHFQGADDDQWDGWAVSDDTKLTMQFEASLLETIMWARYDHTAPVITCFQQGSYQWLLPLLNPLKCRGVKQAPSLVVVLRPFRKQEGEGFVYQVKTVLDLDMALKQARLCGMLSQRWTISHRQMINWQNLSSLTWQLVESLTNPADQHKLKESLNNFQQNMIKTLPSFGRAPKANIQSERGLRSYTPAASSERKLSNASGKSNATSSTRSDIDSDWRNRPAAPAADADSDGYVTMSKSKKC